MNNNSFRPISARLTRTIWLWASLSACLIGLAQAAFSYVHVHADFEMQVRDVGRSSIPLLSVGIWDIEPEAVQRLLDGIVDKPQIGFVRLDVSTGQVFSAGDGTLAAKTSVTTFEVPPPGGAGASIGKLEVYENPGAFYRELFYTVLGALIGYGILTLLICALVVYVLKRELEYPLRHIAHFVSALTPDRLTTPLGLVRPVKEQRDEIDLVVDGFKVLQEGVTGYISNLDELVAQRTAELETAMASIQRLSTVDSLTGCFNRRFFNERIIQELERAERYRRPVSLLFCDIDHFKQINDSYGHVVGDQVLQAVAEVFERYLRHEVDWIARYGGEEFVVVLPETAQCEAIVTAERLRKAIESDLRIAANDGLRVTASFGVAQHRPGESVEVLIEEADALLYQAKAAGRNQTFPPSRLTVAG